MGLCDFKSTGSTFGVRRAPRTRYTKDGWPLPPEWWWEAAKLGLMEPIKLPWQENQPEPQAEPDPVAAAPEIEEKPKRRRRRTKTNNPEQEAWANLRQRREI